MQIKEFIKNNKSIVILVCMLCLTVVLLLALKITQPIRTSPTEREYPLLKPDNLQSNIPIGILVITVEPSDVIVKINPPHEEVASDSQKEISNEVTLRSESTPFKTKLPPGRHQIEVVRKDYITYQQSFEIKVNQTTTLNIKLEPIPNLEERTETNFYPSWQGKLPLTNPHYYVYYEKESAKITALLFPIASFSTPTDTQVEYLKQEVQNRLQSLGVDLQKDTVEWIIK